METLEQIAMNMTIDDLKKAIEKKEEYMKIQEMADDFYYTNGRRKSDLVVLNAYKNELKFREKQNKFNES